MSKHFFQNAMLRQVLLTIYTNYAKCHIWRKGPRVFVNSIPKAGTHLLTAILEEIPGIMLSRQHIETWDVHLRTNKIQPLKTFHPDIKKIRKRLTHIRGGQVVTAHLPWRAQVNELIQQMGFVVIFLDRNPEAILNSRHHYIKGLKRHHLHRRYMTEFPTDIDRKQALIDGISWRNDSPGTEPFAEYLAQFNGWYSAPRVQKIQFEKLLTPTAGGTSKDRQEHLKALLLALQIDADHNMIHKIDHDSANKRSFTFRQGTNTLAK